MSQEESVAGKEKKWVNDKMRELGKEEAFPDMDEDMEEYWRINKLIKRKVQRANENWDANMSESLKENKNRFWKM